MHCTQLFHCRWLLEDWSDEGCQPVLAACQDSLRAVQDYYADVLWGFPPGWTPRDNPPREMEEVVSPEELWGQYLRLHELAREVASQAHASVEPVFEVAQLTVRDAGGNVRRVRPAECDPRGACAEFLDGVARNYVLSKRWGRAEVLREMRDHSDGTSFGGEGRKPGGREN